MPCRTVRDDNGQAIGIACGRGTRSLCDTPGCGRPCVALCDFPLDGEKKGKTCDRKMCVKCRNPIAYEVDYCGPHKRIQEHAAGVSEGE